MQTNTAYNSVQQLPTAEEVIYEDLDPPVTPLQVTPHETRKTRKVQFNTRVFEIVAILALTLAILSLVLVLIQFSKSSIQRQIPSRIYKHIRIQYTR